MAILIISWDNYDRNPYDLWLENTQEDLILICPESNVKSYPKNKFLFIQEINDWSHKNIFNTSMSIYQYIRFSKVIALDELDLEVAGEIRDTLNIKGQSYKSALYFRNKLMMKKQAQKSNINVPAFSKCKTLSDINNFVHNHGYPVVIKPISGVGSVDTYVIRSDEDLNEWYINRRMNLDYYMIEEFINGELYHVDGLVIDHQVKLCWPSKYINDGLDQINSGYVGTYLLTSGNPMSIKLQEFTEKLLNSFPTPANTTFHLEVFKTENNNLVLCEVASRTAGGRFEKQLENVFNININEALVKKISGGEVNLKISPKQLKINNYFGFLILGAPKGIIKEIPTPTFTWINDFLFYGTEGLKYNGPQYCTDSVAHISFIASTESEIPKRIDTLRRWFVNNIILE